MYQGIWVLLVFLVLKAHLDYLVSKVREGQQDHQVLRVKRALQGLMDTQVLWDPLDFLA